MALNRPAMVRIVSDTGAGIGTRVITADGYEIPRVVSMQFEQVDANSPWTVHLELSLVGIDVKASPIFCLDNVMAMAKHYGFDLVPSKGGRTLTETRRNDGDSKLTA